MNQALDPKQSNKPSLNRSKLIIVGIIVLIVAVTALIVLRGHQPVKFNPTEALESGLQTETELNNFKHEVTVTITAAGVTPQTLVIPKDSRINWVNKDSVAHKLAITPGTPTPPKFDNNHLIEVAGGFPYVIHQATAFHYYLVDKPTQGGEVIIRN